MTAVTKLGYVGVEVNDLDAWRRFVSAAGFEELEHYYRPPGRPLREQPWLATVWRKLG